EYGKGFAVVAEEVGNLAQMSGSAATEISTLLDESVRKVETIVDETKRKIDQLMAMNKEKVEAGSHTANECASALEEILQNVGNVDSMVSEIAVASREQSLGIKEISKAVGQMEQVIQKNTTMASSSSTSSEHLKTQADALEHIIHDLQIIVSGHSSKIEVQSSPGVADNVISLKEAKKKRIDAKVEKKPKKEDTKKWTVSKKGNSTASTDEKVGTGKTPKFDKVTVAHPIGEPSKFVVGGETIPAANDPGFRE
ncbi:MAG: methyl-accepting chemotaxis protein, partial [Pseudobdellovibrionaceae bacterium]